MAFTMAYLNFKKGLKMVFGPLGVKMRNHLGTSNHLELHNNKNAAWKRYFNLGYVRCLVSIVR
jgi:hypothetical protein